MGVSRSKTMPHRDAHRLLDLQDGEDGEQGKRDTYDNDDEFIDDSEYVEYFSGDRHKPKFDGFFINRVGCLPC